MLLFSSAVAFSSVAFRDAHHMPYTHKLWCHKDVPIFQAFPCHEALKDTSYIQVNFCKGWASGFVHCTEQGTHFRLFSEYPFQEKFCLQNEEQDVHCSWSLSSYTSSSSLYCCICVLWENKKSWFRLEIRILLPFFLQSGATRNRTFCFGLF